MFSVLFVCLLLLLLLLFFGGGWGRVVVVVWVLLLLLLLFLGMLLFCGFAVVLCLGFSWEGENFVVVVVVAGRGGGRWGLAVTLALWAAQILLFFFSFFLSFFSFFLSVSLPGHNDAPSCS